jgi:hypothetical protein
VALFVGFPVPHLARHFAASPLDPSSFADFDHILVAIRYGSTSNRIPHVSRFSLQ